ncbi:MAG TPA: rod shape-determining protein MreD [Candidatus Eisenbacteria bacterium]|jgi:rod shape-determining protein MreD|nr:rod shape-determining protein MreD [Candidatus Eisenbacteria bacterium]
MRALGGLILLAVTALLMRSTALTVLAARGIVLDALAFATVVWALRTGESGGATFGFVLGLAADLDAAHWLGRHALVLALIGYTIGRLSRTLVRDSARTQLVLVFLATLVHEAWAVAFELGGLVGWRYLAVRVLVAGLWTAPAGVLLLTLVRQGSGQPLFADAALGSRQAA